MEDENAKDNIGGIVPSGAGAIAKSSASLMGRGLRSLSGWDAARVIAAGKELTLGSYRYQISEILEEKLKEFLNPPFWCLLLVDEVNELLDKAELYYEKIGGTADIPPRDHYRIKVGEGLIGQVAESRRSTVITNVQTNAAILAQVQEPQEKQAQSIIAVPLLLDDECIGVIQLIDCVGPGGFSQSDLALLESLADFVAIAISNAKQYGRVNMLLAFANEPTGFRMAQDLDRVFEADLRIYELISEGSDWGAHIFSLVCVVCDELKNLAASLSYAHYIQLLAEVGRKMKEFFEPDHVWKVIHSGEGKFYFFLNLDCEEACAYAQRFYRFFRETIWLQEQGLNERLTASIGVATYPADGQTMAELLHSLDEAINLVKSSTGDGVAAPKIGILPPL